MIEVNNVSCLLYTSGNLLVWAVLFFGVPYAGVRFVPPEAGMMFTMALWLAAVSYTHLDVYKRQMLYRAETQYIKRRVAAFAKPVNYIYHIEMCIRDRVGRVQLLGHRAQGRQDRESAVYL